jgi:hypothetical protein
MKNKLNKLRDTLETKKFSKKIYNVVVFILNYLGVTVTIFESNKLYTNDEVKKINNDHFRLVVLCNLLRYGNINQVVNEHIKIVNENTYQKHEFKIRTSHKFIFNIRGQQEPRISRSFKIIDYDGTGTKLVTNNFVINKIAYDIVTLGKEIKFNDDIFGEHVIFEDNDNKKIELIVGKLEHRKNIYLVPNSNSGYIFINNGKQDMNSDTTSIENGFKTFQETGEITTARKENLKIPIIIDGTDVYVACPYFLFGLNEVYYTKYKWTYEKNSELVKYTGISINQNNEKMKYSVEITLNITNRRYTIKKQGSNEKMIGLVDNVNFFVDKMASIFENQFEYMIWYDETTNKITSIDIQKYNVHFDFKNDDIFFNEYKIIKKYDDWIINKIVIDCPSMFLCTHEDGLYVLTLVPTKRGTCSTVVNDIMEYRFKNKFDTKYTITEINKNIKYFSGMNKLSTEIIMASYVNYYNYDNIIEFADIYTSYTHEIEPEVSKINKKIFRIVKYMLGVSDTMCDFIKPSYNNSIMESMYGSEPIINIDELTDIFNHICGNNSSDFLKYCKNIFHHVHIDVYRADIIAFLSKMRDVYRNNSDVVETRDKIITVRNKKDKYITNHTNRGNLEVVIPMQQWFQLLFTILGLTGTRILLDDSISGRAIKLEYVDEYTQTTYTRRLNPTTVWLNGTKMDNFNFLEIPIIDPEKSMDDLITEYYFGNTLPIQPSLPIFILVCLCSTQKLNNIQLNNFVFNLIFMKFYKSELSKTTGLANVTMIKDMTPFEIFYQCITGLLVREKNYSFINKVFEQVNNVKKGGYLNENIKINRSVDPDKYVRNDTSSCAFSMIMGGGKTRMVTPCLILRIIYYSFHNKDSDKINNIYVVVPDHLVKQTYLYLLTTIRQFFDLNVIEVKEERNATIKEFTVPVTHSNLNINVMSDNSMKCGLINNTQTIRNRINKSVYIFDEIDTILNPIVSELNYMDDIVKSLDHLPSYYNILFELLVEIYKNNTFDKLKRKYKNNIAMTPHFHVTHMTNELREDFIDQCKKILIEKIHVAPNIVNCEVKKTDTELTVTKMYILSLFFNNVFPTILSLVNRLNYGTCDALEQNSTELDNLVTVPFNYVEVPAIGSQFSNPLLVMCLTIIEHLVYDMSKYKKIRKQSYCTILKRMYMEEQEECRKNTSVHKILSKLLPTVDLKEFDYNNFDEKTIDSVLSNMEVIKILCMYLCDKYIKYSSEQESIYGIDLIMSFNTKYKVGYTGTPFASFYCDIDTKCEDIKEFKSVNDLHYDIENVKVPPNIKKMYIHKISKSDFNKIEGAILNCKIDLRDYKENVADMIEHIILDHADHKVIIDAGGVFTGVSYKDIYNMLKKIRDNDTEKFKLIYWDDNHNVMYIDSHQEEHELFNVKSIIKDEPYYYFDHQHTTGIDIDIPNGYRGLLFINTTVRFRDVVQSLFRMRKINDADKKISQSGTFVGKIIYNDKQQSITNNIKMFFENIINNEIKYVNTAKNNLILQNMRSLHRYNMSRDMYKVYNLFNVPYRQQNYKLMNITLDSEKCFDLFKLLVNNGTNLSYVYDMFKLFNLKNGDNIKTILEKLRREITSNEIQQSKNIQIKKSLSVNMNLNVDQYYDPSESLPTFFDYFNYINESKYKKIKEFNNIYILTRFKMSYTGYGVIYYNNKIFIIDLITFTKLLTVVKITHRTRTIDKFMLLSENGTIMNNNTLTYSPDEISFAQYTVRYFHKLVDALSYFELKCYTYLIFCDNVGHVNELVLLLSKSNDPKCKEIYELLKSLRDWKNLRKIINEYNNLLVRNDKNVDDIISKEAIIDTGTIECYRKIVEILSCGHAVKINVNL